jgi:hypothetical protein
MKILELSQPDVRPIKESGELYTLFAKYSWGFELHGKELWPEIKAGFQYDGASVPRIVWTLIGFLPDGIHRPAALIHDWLYVGDLLPDGRRQRLVGGEMFTYNRKLADQLFLKALQHVGVKSWHARLAYLAVRGFGNFYWKD